MKKIFILLFILIIPINVYANEKVNVKYISCADGDTIHVLMNKKEVKVRFLAVDTPELKDKNGNEQPYAKAAKNFTCNKLKNAKKIELEFDKKSNKKDKYDRYLAWVFYDDILLQNELVKRGYADVKYLYDDYKYTDILKESKKIAISKEKGIYSKKINIKDSNNTKENIKKIVKKFLNKLNSNLNKLFTDILEEIL